MAQGGSKFKPLDFISAPRRSHATANPTGTHALYNLSTYSFVTHSNQTGVYALNLQDRSSTRLSDDPQVKDHAWTGDGCEIIWRKQVQDGGTEIWIGNVEDCFHRAYLVGRVEAHVSILKVSRQSKDAFAILILGSGGVDDKLANPAHSSYSSGREYTSLPVREFDHYVSTNRQTLWYLRFHKVSLGNVSDLSKYIFTGDPVNVLKGTGILFAAHSGSLPVGPTNCDLSAHGIILVGQKSGLNNPGIWTSDLFYLSLSTITGDTPAKAQMILTPGLSGNTFLPVFSLDGNSIAFLRTKDRTKVIGKTFVLLANVEERTAVLINPHNPSGEPWALSPESLQWSNDGSRIYMVAPDCGRRKVFKISRLSTPGRAVASCLSSEGSISGICSYSTSIHDNRLLVSKTTFIDSSQFCIVNDPSGIDRMISSSLEYNHFGLASAQVSEIWCPGAGNYKVHTWIIKPSFFENGLTYPVAFFVHGGGTGAWTDSWSMRWNPLVIAEQGYIVVLPNITGSVGYGEDFQLSVLGDVGGRSYRDIEQCFSHIEQNLVFADMNRAVLMGGSFGGFLAFWIAGQPLAKRFKTMVSHAGMFDVYNLYGSDIADKWRIAFGGYGKETSHLRDIFDKWNPARHAENWITPMLIIHNDLDFRCPVSMSLAAFATLQLKGVESRFLNFPDEGHFVLKPENSLHWHQTVIDWINRFTAKGEGQ